MDLKLEKIFKTRLNNFRELLANKKLDAFILFVFEGFNTENCHYISGFRGSSAALIIKSDEAVLITDGRYLTQSKEQTLSEYKIIIQSEVSLAKFVINYLKDLKLKNIGYEADKISHRLFESAFKDNNLNFVDAGDLILSLRRTKDVYEVDAIKEAARIGREAYGRVLESIKLNIFEISESEFDVRLFSEIKRMGAERGWAGHDFIVASGLNSAMCHARATQKKFEDGDIVTVDYGAMIRGYMSDITRNFAVRKIKDNKVLEINNILLNAHHAAAKALRPGISGKDVDTIARKIIEDAGYGKYFMHGLGHGLGLEIHESPRLSQSSNDILQAGDVVTVEPGIYIEGWGGMRIEDDYLITQDGAECLTVNDNQAINII
ncbi:MAG: aminopeptidase P family protein [Synergistaceae bacterium]|nr:aminopeptidase P family protein [Synergistaceae bacterium]